MYLANLLNRKNLLSALLLTTSCVQAQDWATDNLYEETLYEVEVSIFRNLSISTAFVETLNPETTSLEYPSRLSLLQLPREPLAFDFSKLNPAQETAQLPPQLPSYPLAQPAINAELEDTAEASDFGPPYTPATNTFQLPFNNGNNYIPLSGSSDNFSRYNQRLQNASQYALLWHGRWRQPIDNALQGIALSAGDSFGEHHQLEGWVGISQNGANISLEADLWLADFEPLVNSTPELVFSNHLNRQVDPKHDGSKNGNGTEEKAAGEQATESPQYWELPPSPIAVPKIQEDERTAQANIPSSLSPLPPHLQQDTQWQAVHVDVLSEVRPMSINTLNYLDHPAFGVLVEVRPYEPEIVEEALQ